MLQEIKDILYSKRTILDEWYNSKSTNSNPCFYSSVDLRFSGEKLVPVDTNLFPAGFNNLKDESIKLATTHAKEYLNKFDYLKNKKALIIGESHDRNQFYSKNLTIIENILKQAEFDTKINKLDDNLVVENDILKTKDSFIPEIIVLNNDLSTGLPDVLKNITQPIIPDPYNGWFKRRKSNHFSIYNNLMNELQDLVGLPSNLLTAEFAVCKNINFKSKTGLNELVTQTELVLDKIRNKYIKLNISQEPYVVIKSDYGTYGMGIMVIRNSEEIYNMNKKLRNQMNIIRNNIPNEQVIIQEGIKTIDKINNLSSEPLLYFINNNLIEFMYRVHESKNEYSNLNSVGMSIENNKKSENYNAYKDCCIFVAKIANLAASLELM